MHKMLHAIARGAIAVFVATLAVLPTASRADPPTIADFLAPAESSRVDLSPSGRYLSWIRRTGDLNLLVIKDLDTGRITSMQAGESSEQFGGVYVDFIEWKTDDRLLVGLTRLDVRRWNGSETGSVRGYRWGRNFLSATREGWEMIKLRAPRGDDADPGSVLDTLRNDPDHVLMTYRLSSGLHVARVNILTGEAERILAGHSRVIDYITDRDGDVMGRYAYRQNGRVLMLEARDEDGRWTEVYRLRRDDLRDLPDYDFLGATTEPGKAYVAVQPEAQGGEDANTAAVHVFDFATRTMGPAVWRNATYDVTSIVVDDETSELLAGCYWADLYRCDFSDRRLDAIMNGVRRFLGEGWSASVVAQARDNTRWLIFARSPSNPGEYYLYDTEARTMDPIGMAYPTLPETALGQMRRIDYAAADGQALFGYLTRPPGATDDARLPLIVMPHGGPEVRDYLTYDRWVQFLATRGYQVFQPNFRGSAGMGRAFAEAGYRQWGARMQDDVTDGVEHLIENGLVDRDRICIVGSSYGGYAALQGAAAQPDLYRCAASISGISDLPAMLRWERGEAGSDSDRYDYWLKSIGDPSTDRERLDAVSPIRRAADWRTPLLLIHGDDDDIVPISQSRDMERALRRAGKAVRYVVLEDAGHSDWSTLQETTALTELERFLADNLPVAPSSAAAAP